VAYQIKLLFWKEQKYPKQMQAETVILLSF